jgi:4-hydroxybenzoate polyprenyltransferase/phosphoserine phosphatase
LKTPGGATTIARVSGSAQLTERSPSASAAIPLCVDLDGTLLRTDLLWESLAAVLRQQPWSLVASPAWLAGGRARLKQELATRAQIDAATLPYHEPLLTHLRLEKAKGRSILLVTAADVHLARRVAEHLEIFDEVLASDGNRNLRGTGKADALVARFGERGFDYVGDSPVDLPVWRNARHAVLVGVPAGVADQVRAAAPVAAEFPAPVGRWAAVARLLRPHQLVKNLIVLVPLITSHQIANPVVLSRGLLAFLAFSLCASAVYVFNDLLDLDSDRRHASKRWRPLAAGDVPLTWAAPLAILLMAGGLAVSWRIAPEFAGVTLLYLFVATAYSWGLKRAVLVDVFVLAGLYTLRLVAGHVATGIEFSTWLLAFSMFIFLSLALVKRYQELRLRPASAGRVAGRGYTAADLDVLTPLGAASGYIAVLVLALYVNSDKVRILYTHPTVLLLICPLMLYWISRIWLVAHRGEMRDDPVAFALRDRTSYLVGALALLVVWLAT